MENKKTCQKITIGNTYDDIKLVEEINKYKNDKNLKSSADAVRALCKDALAIKKAMK